MQLRNLFPSIVALFIGANFDQANGFAPTPRRTIEQHNMAATLEGWLVNGNVKPVNNFVLVQVADIQEKTDSGILLSKTVEFFFSFLLTSFAIEVVLFGRVGYY